MQAVDGWKWASLLERMAFCRRESACKSETIIDGQYTSTSGRTDSLADCRCPFPLGVVRFGDEGLNQPPEDIGAPWGGYGGDNCLKICPQRYAKRGLTSTPGNTSSVREAATAVVAT